MGFVSVPILRKSPSNKAKRINIDIAKLEDYPIIKFQGKAIKDVVSSLFAGTFITSGLQADISIYKYGKDKIKLKVNYKLLDKKYSYFNNIFEHHIVIDGEKVKFFLKDDSVDGSSVLKALYTSEYNHFSRSVDMTEICTIDDYLSDRESYQMIIEAYMV